MASRVATLFGGMQEALNLELRAALSRIEALEAAGQGVPVRCCACIPAWFCGPALF
jgi:hypothetical protein